MMRVLILGGTKEAREIAAAIAKDARFDVTLSLAGRTQTPAPQPVPHRTGGFGGADGLALFLRENSIGALIDATHPFAAQISANAVAAARKAGVPLGSVMRPGWQELPGDRWVRVATADAAARAIGEVPRHVFLAMGRLELAAFTAAPQHSYIARMIEQPGDIALPPKIEFVFARPPFTVSDERALLAERGIDIVVSKHSGGPETYAKIEAARDLGLPVIMIERPEKPSGHEIRGADDAVRWLETCSPMRA